MAYNPIVSPLPVALQEINSGGASIKNYVSGDLAGDQVPVATGSSKITGWYIFNGGTSYARISFYDAVTAPPVGDLTDFKFSVVIPQGGVAGSAANVSIPAGIQFTTGISFNIGNSINNGGSGTVLSGTVNVNIFYKQ